MHWVCATCSCCLCCSSCIQFGVLRESNHTYLDASLLKLVRKQVWQATLLRRWCACMCVHMAAYASCCRTCEAGVRVCAWLHEPAGFTSC